MWAWDLTGGGLPADFDEATWRALRQHREAPSSLPGGAAVGGGLSGASPQGRSCPRPQVPAGCVAGDRRCGFRRVAPTVPAAAR
ncbi:hypothetical protein [Streptomyces sp. NPDC000931]|uniref:hypothetical protein n=1 Tax=Streptomyces sp. NPDC000931 TaxID=3154372 RepID=UPI003326A7B8